MLNSGEVPIFEPNLKSLINKNVIALKVCKSMVSTIDALGVKIITNNKSSINKYFIY
jgi:UDP-glucose 6-dehydrogenase